MNQRVVILTGASRGFGRALASEFVKSASSSTPSALSSPGLQHQHLVLTARDKAGLEETKAECLQLLTAAAAGTSGSITSSLNLHMEITTISLDLGDLDSLETSIATLLAPLVRATLSTTIHTSEFILVNNAGSLGKLDRIHTQTVSDIRKAIDLNVTAPMALTSAFVKECRNSISTALVRIINISSLAA